MLAGVSLALMMLAGPKRVGSFRRRVLKNLLEEGKFKNMIFDKVRGYTRGEWPHTLIGVN
jgi:hypothetical protein